MTTSKYKLENFSFAKDDAMDTCTEQNYKCPKCKHIGHKHYYLNSKNIVNKHIECITVITHGHFIRVKGTNSPLLDLGRNVWCEIKRTMIPLSDCNIRYTLPRINNLPDWLRDKLNGDDDK